MASVGLVAAVGLVAGCVAAATMDVYQRYTAPFFRLSHAEGGESSTEKVADDVSYALRGRPVPQRARERAGTLVHYLTGACAGLAYVLVIVHWPEVATGFGIIWGLFLSLVLDNLLVPLLGLGVWAWQASPGANLFGITSHVAFGAALEGTRRSAMILLG